MPMVGHPFPWGRAGRSSEYTSCVESCCKHSDVVERRSWAAFVSVLGIVRGTHGKDARDVSERYWYPSSP